MRNAGLTGKGASFDDCIARLPEIAQLGFDVVYLVPIHPIGRVNRKGRDNTTHAERSDPGSPYAIGSAEGAAYMSGLNINRAKIAAFTCWPCLKPSHLNNRLLLWLQRRLCGRLW